MVCLIGPDELDVVLGELESIDEGDEEPYPSFLPPFLPPLVVGIVIVFGVGFFAFFFILERRRMAF